MSPDQAAWPGNQLTARARHAEDPPSAKSRAGQTDKAGTRQTVVFPGPGGVVSTAFPGQAAWPGTPQIASACHAEDRPSAMGADQAAWPVYPIIHVSSPRGGPPFRDEP